MICGSGLIADGLSTACFVLGAEDALPLLEKYDAEAAFVDEKHNIYLTDGMKSRFELMKNTYTIRTALSDCDSFRDPGFFLRLPGSEARSEAR